MPYILYPQAAKNSMGRLMGERSLHAVDAELFERLGVRYLCTDMLRGDAGDRHARRCGQPLSFSTLLGHAGSRGSVSE